MADPITSKNTSDRTPIGLESPSPWEILQCRRARDHRQFCVNAANTAIENLRKMGVDVVVFGSLVDEPSRFRVDSDVDFCVLEKSNIKISDIARIVKSHFGSVKYDLIDLEDAKLEIQTQVFLHGKRHVE